MKTNMDKYIADMKNEAEKFLNSLIQQADKNHGLSFDITSLCEIIERGQSLTDDGYDTLYYPLQIKKTFYDGGKINKFISSLPYNAIAYCMQYKRYSSTTKTLNK